MKIGDAGPGDGEYAALGTSRLTDSPTLETGHQFASGRQHLDAAVRGRSRLQTGREQVPT
jgi:hypothetical protein